MLHELLFDLQRFSSCIGVCRCRRVLSLSHDLLVFFFFVRQCVAAMLLIWSRVQFEKMRFVQFRSNENLFLTMENCSELSSTFIGGRVLSYFLGKQGLW